MMRLFTWTSCALLAMACGVSVLAQSPARPAADQPPAKADKAPPQKLEAAKLQPAREAAALTFARLHHPELADLLVQLKASNPLEYRRAISELFQESERLARLGERSPDRYELALELWKVDSRIRLLAARMTMSEDPALERELKATLHERLEIRIRQLRVERGRLAARIDKIDEFLADFEGDREAEVLRHLQRVKRGLTAASRPQAADAPRPAQKPRKAD